MWFPAARRLSEDELENRQQNKRRGPVLTHSERSYLEKKPMCLSSHGLLSTQS